MRGSQLHLESTDYTPLNTNAHVMPIQRSLAEAFRPWRNDRVCDCASRDGSTQHNSFTMIDAPQERGAAFVGGCATRATGDDGGPRPFHVLFAFQSR